MNMNRMNTLSSLIGGVSHIGMTPVERQMGRLMRAPDAHPDGTPDPNNNNQAGNTGADGGAPASQNNTGEDFDPVAFWNTDGGEANGASGTNPPSSAGPATPPSSTNSEDGNPNFATQLIERINGLSFDGVFTDEIAEQINSGDFKGFNEALQSRMRDAVRQSMVTNVQLIRQVTQGMMTQVQQMIDEKLTGVRQSDELIKAIPSASNPKVGPAIRAIYDQALKNANGDTKKALAATKSMMATLTSETASDLNLHVAPQDPHGTRARQPTNWLEELAQA